MDRFFTHNFQRSLYPSIFPVNGTRDENTVTITKDDGTTSDGGEGEVIWLDSAMFKHAHDCSRCYELPPALSS